MPFPFALSRNLWAALLFTAVSGELAVARQDAAPRRLGDPSLQPRIDAAIDRGIEHLLSRQHRDGSWTGAAFRSYRTGPTAFTAYALVEAGVGAESPSIQMALEYLERTPATMVYSAGSILLLLGEIGDRRHAELAERCMEQLLDWESQDVRGTWSYPSGPVDLSNMQFVALGFWGADRLGLDVPIDVTKRLVEATIGRFQEEPFEAEQVPVEDAPDGTRSRSGKVAGFHYFLERDSRPPTGSMTAAGICIQRIARDLFGKKLGGKLTRSMDKSEALGLRWIGAHWSVEENYAHHEEGQQLLYYLYALERLGALFDTERLEGHLWYEPGARQILALQKEDGGWGRLHETAYALLFLQRATRGGPTSGETRQAPEDAWVLDTGPVRLRANGRMKIVAWVEGLAEETEDVVESVEWSVDGDVVGAASREDGDQRFAIEWSSASAGPRELRAKLTLQRADGSRHEVQSDPFPVVCRWEPSEWMRRADQSRGPNLLSGVEVELEASSEAAGQQAARALDGLEGTAWVAAGTDAQPRLAVRLAKGVRAEAVTLSHAASSIAGVASFAGIRRVRLTVNGDAVDHDIAPESPETIVLPLPRRIRVKSIVIEALEPSEGRRGWAEVGLR